MKTLMVYTYRGSYYLVWIGGTSSFATKEEVLGAVEEGVEPPKEIFSVELAQSTPALVMLKDVIALADERGILGDIKCPVDILGRNLTLRVPGSSSKAN